jgi:hypothetical protein
MMSKKFSFFGEKPEVPAMSVNEFVPQQIAKAPATSEIGWM